MIDKPLKTQKSKASNEVLLLVTVNVTICIRTVSLYHLSEITILHDTAQRLCFQGFSGISEPFTGKAKTETVNLSLKNAILCLKLTGLFHFDILFVGCFSSCRGQPSIFHKKQIMQFTAQPNISKNAR